MSLELDTKAILRALGLPDAESADVAEWRAWVDALDERRAHDYAEKVRVEFKVRPSLSSTDGRERLAAMLHAVRRSVVDWAGHERPHECLAYFAASVAALEAPPAPDWYWSSSHQRGFGLEGERCPAELRRLSLMACSLRELIELRLEPVIRAHFERLQSLPIRAREVRQTFHVVHDVAESLDREPARVLGPVAKAFAELQSRILVSAGTAENDELARKKLLEVLVLLPGELLLKHGPRLRSVIRALQVWPHGATYAFESPRPDPKTRTDGPPPDGWAQWQLDHSIENSYYE